MEEEVIERVPVIGGVADFLSNGQPWMSPESATSLYSKTPDIKVQELPKDIPPQNKLESMSEDDLITLRTQYADRHDVQNYLAPYEHRANMRQRVGENLLTAVAWGALVPAYTAAKMVGAVPTDKETSTNYGEEIKQGYIGIGEGIMQHFQTTNNEEKK